MTDTPHHRGYPVATGHTPRPRQPGAHRPPAELTPAPMADEFDTERIELVAFLMCRGHYVLRYERRLGRVHFAFAGRTVCEELRGEYMIGAGMVSARAYNDALNWARAALHQV